MVLADLVFGQGFLIQRWFLVHRSWCPHKEQGNLLDRFCKGTDPILEASTPDLITPPEAHLLTITLGIGQMNEERGTNFQTIADLNSMFFHLPKVRDHFYLEMKAFSKGTRREEM